MNVVCGITPACPPAGALAATSALWPMPPAGPVGACTHAHVGAPVYVMLMELPAGITYVPAPVPAVTPPTMTAVMVPPMITTCTGKP